MNKHIAITALAASVIVLIFTVVYVSLSLSKAHGTIADQSQTISSLKAENERLDREVVRLSGLLSQHPEVIYVNQPYPIYVDKPVYVDKVRYIYVPRCDSGDWRWR